MATLIKHRNQYCSKIRKWNGIKQETTKIPLRTNKKNIAVVRHHKVEKSEKHIKSGIIKKYQFKGYFEWLNDDGKSKLTLLTLSEAVEQFLNAYKVDVAERSYKRLVNSMNCLFKAVDKNIPIKNISINHIEDFKKQFLSVHKVAGINLNLRNIKTFLRWCNDRNIIDFVPKIKMLKEPKIMPKYISENNMKKIFRLKSISPFMKKAFYLYLTTGCRRSEVIEGRLEGKILIVPAHLSKTRIERQISLKSEQCKIVKEIHIQRDTHLLKGNNLDSFIGYFSHSFRKACKMINIEGYNLHCLRHTFAVTQWIVSNDIYEVKNKLGHTSVKTTEKYAQFNLDKLAQDFPSAYQVRLEVEKVRENAISTPLISTPF